LESARWATTKEVLTLLSKVEMLKQSQKRSDKRLNFFGIISLGVFFFCALPRFSSHPENRIEPVHLPYVWATESAAAPPAPAAPEQDCLPAGPEARAAGGGCLPFSEIEKIMRDNPPEKMPVRIDPKLETI
jgi:hypothetical protein